MKKNLLLIGTMIVMTISGYAFGNNAGYDNGYDVGIEEGRHLEHIENKQFIEEEVRSNVGHRGSYYGIDGFTIKYQVLEGNINDELKD